MSFYKAGCLHGNRPEAIPGDRERRVVVRDKVGAEAPKKKNDMLTVAIVVGLTGLIYFGIPLLKGSGQ